MSCLTCLTRMKMLPDASVVPFVGYRNLRAADHALNRRWTARRRIAALATAADAAWHRRQLRPP
jgi:hypothetical protein